MIEGTSAGRPPRGGVVVERKSRDVRSKFLKSYWMMDTTALHKPHYYWFLLANVQTTTLKNQFYVFSHRGAAAGHSNIHITNKPALPAAIEVDFYVS